MFPLPPSWDPLPGGPVAPLVTIGLPLILLGLLALLACAVILGIDLARKQAQGRTALESDPSATRSDALIAIGRTTMPRAAAGGRP